MQRPSSEPPKRLALMTSLSRLPIPLHPLRRDLLTHARSPVVISAMSELANDSLEEIAVLRVFPSRCDCFFCGNKTSSRRGW